ncbi:unnamed protein product [Cylindrotheca closterium]|uniref:Helicase-associated domain-containing protein n=1 Tax=Cylindrotheca closterium TaxID=2856 RepID=A0AAD2FGP6_9STRA|nr:unnamed protein product [Cylindrotheca closterium]
MTDKTDTNIFSDSAEGSQENFSDADLNDNNNDDDASLNEESDESWEGHFEELKRHMNTHYPDGGFVLCCKCEKVLGDWVAGQRYRYVIKELELERIAKLEVLGFMWEDSSLLLAEESEAEESVSSTTAIAGRPEKPYLEVEPKGENAPDAKSNEKNDHSDDESREESDSNSGADAVTYTEWDRRFMELERHMNYAYADGGYVVAANCPQPLRSWILHQRYHHQEMMAGRPHNMTAENIRRLERIGFRWEQDEPTEKDQKESLSKTKAKGRTQWDTYFEKLKGFMKKHDIYKTGGFVDATRCEKGFSNWVIKQRDDCRLKTLGRDSDITDEQAEKLESIGFHWSKQCDRNGFEPNSDGSPECRIAHKRTIPQPSDDAAPKRQKVAWQPKRARRKVGGKISWDEHFENLKQKMKIHCPNGGYYAPHWTDKKFYAWMGNQRNHYWKKINGEESPMKDEHIAKFRSIGFVFEDQNTEKTKKLQQLDDGDDDSALSDSEASESSDEEDQFGVHTHSSLARRKSATGSSSQTRKVDPASNSRAHESHDSQRIPWEVSFQKLDHYMKKNYPNGGFVRSTKSDMRLSQWIRNQRKEYSKGRRGYYSPLNKDRIRKMESLGFLWSVQEERNHNLQQEAAQSNKPKRLPRNGEIPWDTHYAMLVRFMEKDYPNGGYVTPPPQSDARYGRFSRWVSTQRTQYRRRAASKRSNLTDDRVKKLERLGFLWEPEEEQGQQTPKNRRNDVVETEDSDHPEDEEFESSSSSKHNTVRGQTSWDTHYEILVRFMHKYYPKGGYIKPPPKSDTRYGRFSSWVHEQRSQYKRSGLADYRVEKMERLGFLWEPEQPPPKRRNIEAESEDSDCPGGEEFESYSRRQMLDDSSALSSEDEDDNADSELDDSNEEDHETGRHSRIGLARRTLTASTSSSSSGSRTRRVDRPGDPLGYSDEEDEEDEDEEIGRHSSLAARTGARTQRVDRPAPNNLSGGYESLDKRQLVHLFKSQLNHVELLRKETAKLQSELQQQQQQQQAIAVVTPTKHDRREQESKRESKKYKARLVKQKEKNQRLQGEIQDLKRDRQESLQKNARLRHKHKERKQSLKGTIRDLKDDNKKLAEKNMHLTQCNDNLRQSHVTAMVEERTNLQRETRKRKLAENRLEEAKKRIPMEW